MNINEIKEIIANAAEDAEHIHSHPQMCGCYSCLAIFHSSELDTDNRFYSPNGKSYVTCQHCGVDAVICEDDLVGKAPLNEDTLSCIHNIAFGDF